MGEQDWKCAACHRSDCRAEETCSDEDCLACASATAERLEAENERIRTELESARAGVREALKVCRESGVRIGELEGEAILLRAELELARAVCEAAEHLRTELVGHETDDALLDAMVSCDAAIAAYKAHQGASK